MNLRLTLDRLALLALCIGLWQGLSAAFGTYWVSSPWRATVRFFELSASGELAFQAAYTVEASIYGFLAGGIAGVLLPFALRKQPVLNAVLDPYFAGGYGIPKLALAPLFVLWFGIDLEPKVALVASIVFFVMFFSVMAGVQAVNAQLVNMARVAGASERAIARHIVWPGAVPYAFAGFRIAAPYSIGAAVVGELISSNRGLGYMIQAGATDFDTTTVFVGLAALTLIVVIVNTGVAQAERWLLRWRPRSGAGASWVQGG
ncbi:MAG: ABC transporter permease [Burkholderiales bacterium]|nr:ABC transporter permease [Burkholderiales bacterium]